MKRELLVEHRLPRAALVEHRARNCAEARARGLRYYFTGEPCIHGHVGERFVSSRQCCMCHKQRALERAVPNKRVPRALLIEHQATSRDEAKARGLKFYFTGELCRRGHKAVRHISGDCLACKRIANKAHRRVNPMQIAFLSQRGHAKRRGIQFLFSFEEWRDWWITEDRWSRRGRGSGQLVMARKGDEGPYSADNVYCATAAKNIVDANLIRTVAPRTAAMAQGLTRYTTGRPCRHGHIAERRVDNGICCACLQLAGKAKVKHRRIAKAAEAGRNQLDAKPQRIKLRRSTRRIRPTSSLSLF